jgi:hypothetical protein
MLQSPGAGDISLGLLYDIRTTGPALKSAQDYLKAQKPPTLGASNGPAGTLQLEYCPVWECIPLGVGGTECLDNLH